MSEEEPKKKPGAGQDIRKFFQLKSAPKTAADGGPAKPKTAKAAPATAVGKKQTPGKGSKQETAANGAGPSTKPKPSQADESNKGKSGAKGKDEAKTEGKGPSSGSKRKKSNVIVIDDDDDDDYKEEAAMSSEDDEGDDDFMVDDDSDGAPAAKKARTTPAAKAGAARGKASASPAAKPRASSSKRAPKRELPKMVVEPHKKATPASPAEGSAKKARKAGELPELPKQPKKQKVEKAVIAPDVQRAIDLVDAAAEKLPALSEDQLTFMESGGFGGAEQDPQHPGSKDIPSGHPECFTGKTFVFSGTLDSLYRHEAKELVERLNGRVTGDVSGRSSFLVVGTNCSKRKYLKAGEKKVKVVDEDGMLALIAASAPAAPQQAQQQQQGAALAMPGPVSDSAFHGGAGKAVPVLASLGQALASSSKARTAAVPRGAAGAGTSGAAPETQLWVDKHKPTNATELVGNPGVIQDLRTWLACWDAVHLRGAAPPASKGGGKAKDYGKKAVLLSGPPGIGKTSSAHIIAKELGFSVVEANASDTRNKSDAKSSGGIAGKLSNVIREMVTSTSIAGPNGQRRKQVLVMDEVDGMSGGDRGGVTDLIITIKASKVPIICICNDRYAQKLKSLRNHCLELDFRKPTPQQITKRMIDICAKEGLHVNEATMKALGEASHGDLRLILGQLQMTRLRQTALSYDEVKGRQGKDSDMSPFECARRLLDPSSKLMSIADQMDLVFQDADLVPLLVAENYPNHKPAVAASEGQRLRAMAKAADCVSLGDVVNTSVRFRGNWGLMPFGAMVGTVTPAAYMRGNRETFNPHEMNFPRFTSLLGHMSTSNKQRRLLSELATNMAAAEGTGSNGRGPVRLDYVPALRTLLTLPLKQEGEAGIPKVLDVMQGCCIDREHFDFILDVSKFKTKAPWGEDPMTGVETRTKSAFTRTFNKQGLKARTNTMVEEVKLRGAKGAAKKKATGRGRGAAGGDGGGEGGDAVVVDAEDAAPIAEEGAAKEASKDDEEEEEEEVDEEQLAAKLRSEGISLQLTGAAGSSGARGRGRGRGGAAGGRGSRGGKGSGGARASGGARGRGRGK